MKGIQCSVCKAGVALVRYVDASPELSHAALSRQAEAIGMDLSPERIATHRKHRKGEEPARIAKTRKDFAVLVAEKAVEQFESGELNLMDKDTVPGIKAGLAAQGLMDRRAASQRSNGTAELAFAIIEMLGGRPREPLALDDGLTIEGDFVEAD